MSLQSGSRLGTYEILGPLGAGGMGEVYRARDRKLGREVAIKVLREAFAADPARAARFEREARILAALNHPGIAAIYGLEKESEVAFIVMELVPGVTLSERLAGDPMPVPEALDVASQIAEALSTAHEKGVVHRDLKPANIKITPAGRVKILDFGLAKAMEPATPQPPDMSNTPTLALDDSHAGHILGTPGFMSPEQARGRDTDRRTDIWAFGCVLYEMLTGRRAFGGESVPEVLAKLLDKEPDWAKLPPATPPGIRELLRRCLEKDPERRLRDAADARLEIESARAGPRSAVSGWRTAAAILAGGVIVLVGSLALRSSAPSSPELPGSKQLVVLPFRDLTGDPRGQLMGDGLVETVSVRLAGVPGLQVVTPRAAVQASDKEKEVFKIARDVGANLVMLPTVQLEKDRMRITYRIVSVRDGVQVAANSVDGSVSDLFGLQDRLSESVTRDLRLPTPARRLTATPGLDAPGQQERYLQAIGLLQRYDKRESVEAALDILRGLEQERPNSAPVQAALGRASLAMFEFTKDQSWADRAMAAADAARRLDPDLPAADVAMGATLLATGRGKEATEAFRRALAVNPDDFEAVLGLGRACESTHDDAAAEAAFQRAIALQPSSFAGYSHLGGFYYDRGRYAVAAETFRKAARMAPDSYRALSNLGGASMMACDHAAASDAFQKALALRPDNATAASNVGLNQIWTGRYTQAVVSLEAAVRYGPNDFRIWGNLGDAYRSQGRQDKAVEAWGRALVLARDRLRLNPRDTQAYQIVATSLAKTGHAADADEPMRQALALDPADPDVLSNAASVAALAGRFPEALQWLRKAVDAGYCPAILARQPEFARLSDEPAFRSILAEPRRAAGS